MSEAYQTREERPVELLFTDPAYDAGRVTVAPAGEDPLAGRTLGGLGIAYEISAGVAFPPAYLRIAFDPREASWIEPTTIRLFHRALGERRFRPVWHSGLNLGLGYVWGRVERAGTYAALGLPSDRLLLEALRELAATRRAAPRPAEDARLVTVEPLERLLLLGGGELDDLRDRITGVELAFGADPDRARTARRGKDFGIVAPLLPGGVERFEQLELTIRALDPPPEGLPEEELFYPPAGRPPLRWPPEPEPAPVPRARAEVLPRGFPDLVELSWLRCLLGAADWPMYMHDREHTGRATCSGIDSATVPSLKERYRVRVDGSVNSQPAIVGGHVYVTTMDAPQAGVGGYVYRINLVTGVHEGVFAVDDGPARQGQGIACTPAVIGGKVYFSALNGKVYRLDAATMTQDWVVDLRKRDLAHAQPVDHGSDWATGWSSPLVVNGRVYVGSGEGEHDSFGYVYCLDAATGNVVWLFCTDKFVDPDNPGNENQPNVIPPSHWTGPGSPPAPFLVAAADPPHPGAAPWSSAAYDAELNRIYIGTGNAEPDDPLPDPRYASGVLSLDAATGAFRGFFQPAASDSYRPRADDDVDVPGGPTVFTRRLRASWEVEQRVVGIGSKNGSYFLLDADGLALLERRQLLPYDALGNPFPAVDPPHDDELDRENKSGVFGTASVDATREALFVGLGGYSAAIDSDTTPFVRAMSWDDLSDVWPTTGVNPPRYSMASPPLYTTPGEAGLTNTASVNDVVFVGTTKPGLYALHADTGLALWSPPLFGPGSYCLGAAISGNYVVAGTGGNVYVYSL